MYKYFIFPSKIFAGPKKVQIHDNVYLFWKTFWRDIFAKHGLEDHLNRDHFLRQDLITFITTKNQKDIVGLHLYTFFNFQSKACIDNPFFDDFTDSDFSLLSDANIHSGMCMEYLSVNPLFRKSNTGISFGEVLIGLGLNVMKEKGLDCVFGTAREDVKVDKMAQAFGGKCFKSGIKKYDYPCSLMVISNKDSHENKNPDTKKIIADLWENKVNLLEDNQHSKLKTA